MQYKTIKSRGESKYKSMMKAELRFFAFGEFPFALKQDGKMLTRVNKKDSGACIICIVLKASQKKAALVYSFPRIKGKEKREKRKVP